jgi:hypothetical protein
VDTPEPVPDRHRCLQRARPQKLIPPMALESSYPASYARPCRWSGRPLNLADSAIAEGSGLGL